MGMTLTEKILARHAGVSRVEPGQIINANVDLVLAKAMAACCTFFANFTLRRQLLFRNAAAPA